jgi:hypothetical protein
MKKILFIALIGTIATSCQLSTKYKISGKIINSDDKWLILERMELDKTVHIDSVKLNDNGTFKFVGQRLKEPTFFRLKLKENNFITLLVDSTERLQVQADGKNLEKSYNVQNSLGSGYIKILNRKMRLTQQATDSLVALYAKLPENDWANKKRIENEYLASIDTHKKFIGSFVMENPRSFASYYALLLELNNAPIMNVMDKKDMIFYSTIATSLNLLYPESERVKHLYSYVLRARQMQRREEVTQKLMEQAEPGIPNIEAPNRQGINVSLNSLKGKTILVSFWASIDQNSRMENRNLKRIYSKYKSKGFEIYQVSLDQSKILWENAVVQDGADWISVCDLKSIDSPNVRLYNISSIPANYLINKDGDIIGKDLFGTRLEEKLAEILK